MRKTMLKQSTLLIATMMASLVGLFATQAVAAKKALVEVTGQTTSYAEGDDGDIQAGVPFPARRFTDKRNGTVKDNLTRLIWLKNANCFGNRSWDQALTDANTLADGSCGLTDNSEPGDWRLPNVKELQSLVYFGAWIPALPLDHPFVNAGANNYWSSTTDQHNPLAAWIVNFFLGATSIAGKEPSIPPTDSDDLVMVWPVRGGQ